MKATTFGCNKPPHFIEFYERVLPKNPKRLLEIGVQTGRSLRMWANAFPNAEIVGIDINRPSEEWPEKNITFIRGDQTDVGFLKKLGEFDVIIDDGSHIMSHQQISFHTLFDQLKSGGVYIIEDLETCYIDRFIDAGKTTDMLKGLIDDLNTAHTYSRLEFIEHLALIQKT